MKKLTSVLLVTLLLALTAVSFVLPASAEETTLWLTHYNNNTIEGAGVIFTESYSGAVWWYHVQFTPVEGEDGVYEITAISNGLNDGSGVAQEVPEGGFVYALNTGNDYVTLYPDDPSAIDYTSDACNAMRDIIVLWSVGDKFTFTNVDLENLTVPTSTPDTNWYEDDYVCTATFATVVDDSLLPDETDAPADDSQPADDSEPGDTSVPADTSAAVSDTSAGTSAPANNNAWIYILVAIVAVIIVVIVVAVVTKKKK